MNTVKASFGPVPKNSNAEQPKTPLVGAGSLIAMRNGELKDVITVRTYYASAGTGMQPVRACVWVNPADGSEWRSGRGSAGGCGYHKESAAIAAAVSACGISLHGSLYNYRNEPVDMKRSIDFGGTGSSGYADVFKAIARAAGYRGRMLWVSHGL